MQTFKITLILVLIGLSCAGDIHRIFESRWNVPQEGKSTKLGLYFALDNRLREGGTMNIEL